MNSGDRGARRASPRRDNPADGRARAVSAAGDILRASAAVHGRSRRGALQSGAAGLQATADCRWQAETCRDHWARKFSTISLVRLSRRSAFRLGSVSKRAFPPLNAVLCARKPWRAGEQGLAPAKAQIRWPPEVCAGRRGQHFHQRITLNSQDNRRARRRAIAICPGASAPRAKRPRAQDSAAAGSPLKEIMIARVSRRARNLENSFEASGFSRRSRRKIERRSFDPAHCFERDAKNRQKLKVVAVRPERILDLSQRVRSIANHGKPPPNGDSPIESITCRLSATLPAVY